MVMCVRIHGHCVSRSVEPPLEQFFALAQAPVWLKAQVLVKFLRARAPTCRIVGRPLFSDCRLHTVSVLPVALYAQCLFKQEDDIRKPIEEN